MSGCARSIAPRFNRCVIFNTARDSFHGHPEPMTCPQGVKRRSIALYYYTVEDEVEAIATEYRSRPQDNRIKAGLIFLDKLAVAVFHTLKSTLRISDSAATSIMSIFRKKR